MRAVLDARSETIGRKVLEARLAGVPMLWAVGKREAERRTVSVRARRGAARRGAADSLSIEAALRSVLEAIRPPGV